MAKNNDLIIHRPNTIQENARVLHNLQRKEQGESERKEDLDELFARLNRDNSVKSNKNKEQQNASWYSKNVMTYTYGPITGFSPGSWWGIRMDCSRDRVHDPFDEDVQSGPFGVTSICTSNSNIKEDVDFGDFLTLTGQIYLHGQYSKEPLVKNYQQQIPLRLIRTYNRLNEFAPKTGYRYDGLYIVIGSWIGISLDSTKYHKFALKRIFAQDPAPWSSNSSLLAMGNSCSRSHAMSTSSISTGNTCCGVYEFKRFSRDLSVSHGWKKCNIGKESVNLPDITGAFEKQKLSNSAIVTRHVFKKVSPNTENTMTLGGTPILDDKVQSRFGSQTSKAHSTNISIRTGLYDSSPIIQQDIRKSAPLSICRSLKPVNIFKSNIQIESLYTLNKEKAKGDGMIDISKDQLKVQRVDNMANSNQTKGIVKANTSMMSHFDNIKKRTRNTSQRSTSMHMHYYMSDMHKTTNSSLGEMGVFQVMNNNLQDRTSISMCKRKVQPISQCNHEQNEIKIVNKINSKAKETFYDTRNLSETSTKKLKFDNTLQESIIKDKVVPEKQKPIKTRTEFLSYPQSLKSLESLESLTPDKILNLINEEKYHPLSKLLMGNIIGLSSEDAITLRTQSSSDIQLEKRDIEVPQKSNADESSKKSFITTVEDSITARHYKFRRRKKFKETIRNKLKRSDVSMADRCNKAIPSPLCKNVNHQFDISEENSLLTNVSTVKEHLQCNDTRNKLTVNIQQDIENGIDISTQFKTVKNINSSKRFIKDNAKKHTHKKHSREVANLLIDAKVEPKMRGPRNRRLRCISNIHTTERPYEPFSTVICTSKKYKINMVMSRETSNFKKKSRLPKSRKQKTIVETQALNDAHLSSLRMTKNNVHKNFDICTVRHYENMLDKNHCTVESFKKENNNNNNKKSKNMINRKNRLIQRVPASAKHDTVVKHASHEQTKFTKTSTTDAIIQCSLLSEKSDQSMMSKDVTDTMYNNTSIQIKQHIDRCTCVKAELNDIEYMKFESQDKAMCKETYKDHGSHQILATHVCHKTCQCNDGCVECIEIQDKFQKSPAHEVSAFVAVNISNSDLRIARLRSIGFKPIMSHQLWVTDGYSSTTSGQNSKKCTAVQQSKVMKQDVAEKYNKYTNEDNNVVVYMDEELQYQDIENEDMGESSKRMFKAHVEAATSDKEFTKEHLNKELYHGVSLEQETEPPWHGWKKIETTENSYWIGW